MHPLKSRFEFQDYRYRSLVSNHHSHFTHLDSKSSASSVFRTIVPRVGFFYLFIYFYLFIFFFAEFLFNFCVGGDVTGGQQRMTDDPATSSGDSTFDFCSMFDQSLEVFLPSSIIIYG